MASVIPTMLGEVRLLHFVRRSQEGLLSSCSCKQLFMKVTHEMFRVVFFSFSRFVFTVIFSFFFSPPSSSLCGWSVWSRVQFLASFQLFHTCYIHCQVSHVESSLVLFYTNGEKRDGYVTTFIPQGNRTWLSATTVASNRANEQNLLA